jgi:phage terminase large subunit-like protein
MEVVPQTSQISISTGELVKLCAVDNDLYCMTFFPKTYRQKNPSFDRKIWDALDDPSKRLINMLGFRGSAKTTRARTFTSKRVAYGLSRTILYVASSEDGAIRSIRWLKRQVERNTLWASTFGLKQGEKWTENEIQIENTVLGISIWILGVGITSTQLRGINFDDYRPDLILLDDTLQDENSATQEQRMKLENLVLTALKNSLAPRVDEPNAKMVCMNTPQHREDYSQKAKRDPEFFTIEVSCWTPETNDLPVTDQISVWPERYPTAELRAQKLAAMNRNQLSGFTREMEVKLTSKEDHAFRREWLKIYISKPAFPYAVLGIDPVPPPSEREIAQGFAKKDYEAHYVWGRENGEYFLLDAKRSRGHQPDWTINSFFTLAYQYQIAMAVVESVAYQRTLKWLLEKEMERRRQYYMIIPYVDKRKKSTRIISAFTGIGSAGKLHIGPEHTIFADQFENYSETFEDIDDDLDASAIALSQLINPALERGGGRLLESDVEDLPQIRRCP